MTKVFELPNFPYKSFKQLQEAEKARKIIIGVDKTVAREWMVRGKRSASFWRTIGLLLHLVPHLLSLGIIIYSILSKEWLLLLLIIPIEFSATIFIPLVIIMGPSIYFILTGQFILLLFVATTFTIAFFSVKILYRLSSDLMRTAALNNEEFLNFLYEKGCLSILSYETGEIFKKGATETEDADTFIF